MPCNSINSLFFDQFDSPVSERRQRSISSVVIALIGCSPSAGNRCAFDAESTRRDSRPDHPCERAAPRLVEHLAQPGLGRHKSPALQQLLSAAGGVRTHDLRAKRQEKKDAHMQSF
jgi:hypothetical protein